MKIRTRFAPSPTGYLHIGGLRTAAYSYAFAKNKKGDFILRIEDTDRNRFVAGSTEKIYEILKIFGLNWDEGPLVGGKYKPYIQSERVKTGIYKKYADKLVADGHAYYCFHPAESKEVIKESHAKKEIKLRDSCRDLTLAEVQTKINTGETPAVRLRLPENKVVHYFDFVKNKEITWNTDHLDEVMLLKSDGYPTYHLAVTVDDCLMEITHILRAHEWLPSTPIHILLWEYLGFKSPNIGHLTAILDPSGGKLSKRKHNVSCEQFLADGYLPEALLNFVILLGWAPIDNRELFTLAEFVEYFDKGHLQVSNPVFNDKKLNWLNGLYIRQKSSEELFKLLKPFAPKSMDDSLIKKTIPLVKERMIKLSDYLSLVNYLVEDFELDIELITQKGGGDKNLIKTQFSEVLEPLQKLGEWKLENLDNIFHQLVEKNNWHLGKFFMATRVAITGKAITPPLFEIMELLGKEKTITRIKKALEMV